MPRPRPDPADRMARLLGWDDRAGTPEDATAAGSVKSPSSTRDRLLHEKWSLGSALLSLAVVMVFVVLIEFGVYTFGIAALAVILLSIGFTFAKGKRSG